MDAELAEVLWSWRQNSGYPKPEDWVFGSPAKDGEPTVLATHFVTGES
jgi:hypothetical protein